MVQEQRAVTVSEYVTIVPGAVADTRIIGATQSAAEIYGYPNPDKLVGRFLSQTLDRDDMLRGCLMSLARLKGHDVPTRYPTKIVRPDGHIIPVVKDTIQIATQDRIFWITELERIDTIIPSPVPTPNELGISDADVLKYRGALNIADLEALLASQGITADLPLSMSDLPLTMSDIHTIMSEIQSVSNKKSGEEVLATGILDLPQVNILPGQTQALPDGDYLHRCARCGFVWQSPDPNPDKCPRTRADRRSAQACGVRRWRVEAT